MAALHEFVLHRPQSLRDAAALLAAPDARAIAGGTDLVTNLRRGIERPHALVDLAGLPGLGPTAAPRNLPPWSSGGTV